MRIFLKNLITCFKFLVDGWEGGANEDSIRFMRVTACIIWYFIVTLFPIAAHCFTITVLCIPSKEIISVVISPLSSQVEICSVHIVTYCNFTLNLF